MKKTLLALGVISAIICCAAAYALTGQNQPVLLKNADSSSAEFHTEIPSSATKTAMSGNSQADETLVAQPWTSDSTLPGLGLNNLTSGTYTVVLNDGVTTLGLFYNGNLYVTGLNTTASEVVLPQNIMIGEKMVDIYMFGNGANYYTFDWSGAPNLTKLDVSATCKIYIRSFNNSAITDLYVGKNTSFQTSPSNTGNIYIHIWKRRV